MTEAVTVPFRSAPSPRSQDGPRSPKPYVHLPTHAVARRRVLLFPAVVSPPLVRVLIVDDHPLVRAGVHSALAGAPGIAVVGDAADGPAALAAVSALSPDVVLMDVNLPGLDGASVTRQLRELHPTVVVIALSAHGEAYRVRQLLDAGAASYLLKTDVGPAELSEVIRQVLGGRASLPPSVREALAHETKLALLSNREREVLTLLATGLANKEIAAELGIAVRTVETFRLRIHQKLKLHGTAALTRWAIEHGLARADRPPQVRG